MPKPPPVEDRIKCSACGTWNDPKTRPHGGEFTHQSATTTINGTSVTYDANGSQGCWFCGSPAWNTTASLGDMTGWFSKK